MAIKLHSTFAVHPGPWLKRNVIDHFALSVPDAADRLGVSRQSISKLLNGRQGLTAEMAIRFEKAFGLKADTLLRMQSAHELAEARAHEDEIVVERVGPNEARGSPLRRCRGGSLLTRHRVGS